MVVPCHDEEGNLARYAAELLPALASLGRSFEVVIVDDGSNDGTGAAAARLAAADPRVRVVSLTPNRGLGGALRAGFAACRGEWVATLDADLTFRPAALAGLLEKADAGADLVAGSPYLRPGDMAGVPWARRLPSLMMNALYRGLFGLALTAYTPVFRLYRAARLRELTLTSEGFEINAEIAARALLDGWKVAEAPAALETRVAGASKLRRWRELSRHAALIARLLFGR
ncbi:MAG: glycosyltransferase family 2 protein [Elusimicrobiota bacterium]|nr:glycosyltransferase family 2 protein [Elusimicrobiota bacterium]